MTIIGHTELMVEELLETYNELKLQFDKYKLKGD